MKNCPIDIIHIIVSIFNIVLKTGIVPTDWCIGIIQPIYKKKGSSNDADNYRGITLLSCIGKLFTACINNRLTNYVEATGSLGEEQAGFREGYSTNDHTFVLQALIDLYLSKNKRLYCAFIDYKKAFDLIDRSSLWSKLIANQINGNLIRVVYNLYENAKSCVKQGIKLSNLFSCNIGVRQGENLSPLLFAIYLNDFELFVSRKYDGLSFFNNEANRVLSDDDVEFFIKMYVLLYADDTVVLAESPKELQCALDSVYDYCKLWHLTVNTTKTKVVIFSKGKVKKLPVFQFGDNTIGIVDDYVYLGVTFNYNGSFQKIFKRLTDRARGAMFSLITKARRLALPIDIQMELFDKTVLPILLYSFEIWGYSNMGHLEIFYRKFLKNTLKLGKSTPNSMVYGEFGKSPLQTLVEKRMLSFWIRISEGKASKLSSIMYRLVYGLHKAGEHNLKWISKIKSILDNSGFTDLWEMHEHYSSRNFVKIVFQRLDDINLQTWHSNVNNGESTATYKIIKQNLKLEPYLTKLNFQDRITMSKFRCANNRLPANANRFSELILQKNCTLCERSEIGDEFHYLFTCPFFEVQRKLYIKKYYYNRPNTLKMQQLFESKNLKQLSDVAKFSRLIMFKF